MKKQTRGPLRRTVTIALLPTLIFFLINCASEDQTSQTQLATTNAAMKSHNGFSDMLQPLPQTGEGDLVLALTPVEEFGDDDDRDHRHDSHDDEDSDHERGEEHRDESDIAISAIYLNITHIAMKLANGGWVDGPDFRTEAEPDGYTIMIGGLAGNSTVEAVSAVVSSGDYKRVRVYLGEGNYFALAEDPDTLLPLEGDDDERYIDFKVKGKNKSPIRVADQYQTTVYAMLNMDDAVESEKESKKGRHHDDYEHRQGYQGYQGYQEYDDENRVDEYELDIKVKIENITVELIPEEVVTPEQPIDRTAPSDPTVVVDPATDPVDPTAAPSPAVDPTTAPVDRTVAPSPAVDPTTAPVDRTVAPSPAVDPTTAPVDRTVAPSPAVDPTTAPVDRTVAVDPATLVDPTTAAVDPTLAVDPATLVDPTIITAVSR